MNYPTARNEVSLVIPFEAVSFASHVQESKEYLDWIPGHEVRESQQQTG